VRLAGNLKAVASARESFLQYNGSPHGEGKMLCRLCQGESLVRKQSLFSPRFECAET
jgi:hypothetical protein